MRAFLIKLLDLYIYSSLHISIAVVSLVAWSYLFVDQALDLAYLAFCFFATMGMYTAHRLVGLKRIPSHLIEVRFEKLKSKNLQLWINGLIAFVGLLISFFFLEYSEKKMLLIPVIISIGYTFPFLGSKRIRDFPFIKIVLIAAIWAWITIWIPVGKSELSYAYKIGIFLERFCFIFAITLPFDIRDLKIDQMTAVKTIPLSLGLKKTRILALCFIGLSIISNLYFFIAFDLAQSILIGAMISYGIILWLISKTNTDRSDYFYAGLLDGTMLNHAVILILVNSIFN